MERRVSETEDAQRDHQADIQALKLKVKNLETRAEDVENQNRYNNLRVLSLPEGAEGYDPLEFMEGLLPSLLPRAKFFPHFSIERVHVCRLPEALKGPHHAPRSCLSYYTTGTMTQCYGQHDCKENLNMRIQSSSYCQIIL